MKNYDTQICGLMLANQDSELLQQALDSLTGIGPVILLDTSPDGALSKLNRSDLKVIREVGPESDIDYGRWRNQLIAACQSEWFFFLDSDEVLTDEGREAILEYVNRSDQNQPALACLKRVDFFWDKPLYFGEVGNNWVGRLGRVGEVKFKGRVHEVPVVRSKPIAPAKLKGQINHFAHPNIHSFIESVSHYAKLVSEETNRSYQTIIAQLVAFPLGKFLINFIMKSGWRDGWRGLIYALTMSLHSLWVRVYTYEKNHR